MAILTSHTTQGREISSTQCIPMVTQVAIVCPPPKYRVRTQRGTKLSRNCSRWTDRPAKIGRRHPQPQHHHFPQGIGAMRPSTQNWFDWLFINKSNGMRFSLDSIVSPTQFIKEPSLTIQSAVGDRLLRLIEAVTTVWGILNLPLDTACCEWRALSQEADLERLRTY
ncbi:hypothetical protein PENFLA_c020G04877 [Penicillium flavigenum]|uniref:Uncharacterized protein n=1 Tax=Penicillium flavigenum TaxID=254877 RepID=A0A1V6SXT3_9EURO|nr:hypothetical protein PENFLA_c020G04877 [Penicillium flavigenum]